MSRKRFIFNTNAGFSLNTITNQEVKGANFINNLQDLSLNVKDLLDLIHEEVSNDILPLINKDKFINDLKNFQFSDVNNKDFFITDKDNKTIFVSYLWLNTVYDILIKWKTFLNNFKNPKSKDIDATIQDYISKKLENNEYDKTSNSISLAPLYEQILDAFSIVVKQFITTIPFYSINNIDYKKDIVIPSYNQVTKQNLKEVFEFLLNDAYNELNNLKKDDVLELDERTIIKYNVIETLKGQWNNDKNHAAYKLLDNLLKILDILNNILGVYSLTSKPFKHLCGLIDKSILNLKNQVLDAINDNNLEQYMKYTKQYANLQYKYISVYRDMNYCKLLIKCIQKETENHKIDLDDINLVTNIQSSNAFLSFLSSVTTKPKLNTITITNKEFILWRNSNQDTYARLYLDGELKGPKNFIFDYLNIVNHNDELLQYKDYDYLLNNKLNTKEILEGFKKIDTNDDYKNDFLDWLNKYKKLDDSNLGFYRRGRESVGWDKEYKGFSKEQFNDVKVIDLKNDKAYALNLLDEYLILWKIGVIFKLARISDLVLDNEEVLMCDNKK